MKSFFSGLKLGAPSTATSATSSSVQASAKRSPGQSEQQMPDMLGKAEKILQKLRSSTSHDFPLLNEATRLVQLLEGSVTKMPDTEVKGVWREQVNELQRSLQTATEKMLASDMPPAAPAPPQPQKASQGRSKAPHKAAQPTEPASGGYEAPIMLASADMFSGLDLPGFDSEATPSASPADTPVPQYAAAPEALDDRTASSGALPLPADLFTGLNHAPPQQSAAPVDPFAAPQQPPSRPEPRFALPSSSTAVPGASTSSTAGTALPSAAHASTSTRSLPESSQAQLANTASDGRRKKKTTRRVGYARDDAAEAPVQPATAGSSAAGTIAPSGPVVSTSAAAAAAAAAPPPPPPPPPTSSASSQPAATPAAAAPTGAPLAATHTTAALLDIVSSTPASHAALDSPAPPMPVAIHSSSAMPDSKHALHKHHSPKAGASAAQTATQAQTKGSPRATARSTKPQKGAAQALSALADLLPVAVSSMARQDSRGAAPLSPRAMVQAARMLSFDDGLQSVQNRAETEIAALADSMGAAVRDEQAARNKRQTFVSDAAADAGQIRQLEDAEQLAVEQEDFEAAANLSTELDALRAHMQALDRSTRAAEGECEAAVARRAQLALRQVAVWQAAAEASALLQASQEQAATKAARQSDKELHKLAEAIAASEEHMEELQARITARQDWINKEQASVDAKIEEAIRPVAAERAEAAEVHSTLLEEVEELRRQLQEKEEALAAASDKLADIDQHMHSLAAKYDKTLARLAEDHKAVTAEEAERDAEEAAVADSRAQASQAEAATKTQQSKFDEQVAAAREQSSDMLSRAAAISAAVEAEARVQQVQAGLRDQEEQASAAVKELEDGVETSRVEVRALANRRAALANEAAAGEAQAAVARRRIPELEADKKTAAAARDFKGAAALSAEAKSLATQADQAMSKAHKLRQQVSEAEQQEQEKLDVIRKQEAALAAAKREAALAKWRRLQASMQGLSQQTEQAAAADNFDEATALQAELDSATTESAALASEHGFSPSDAKDLLHALPASSRAQTAIAAAAKAVDKVVPSNPPAMKGTRTTNTQSNNSSASSLGADSNQDAHNPILLEELIGNGHILASKGQIVVNELSAAALNRQADHEDEDDEDADQDGLLVGDSSSVISASHAATDGSRSVQSSRTVLDKMPEFNMDDAVSFRSVSSSRSASQPLHADMRSVRAPSTRDDADKADEADETSSFRSMSSTTSTNYAMPRARQTVRPLYTIPDEATADDDDEAETSSTAQSEEEEAADGLLVSAAAQALHQEADALVSMSHHTSDTAESLSESGMEADASTGVDGEKRLKPSSSKSIGSLGSLSGGLSPVSEVQSSGQDQQDDDANLLADSIAYPSDVDGSAAQPAQQSNLGAKAKHGEMPAELQSSKADVAHNSEGANPPSSLLTEMLSSQASIDPDIVHTPRAMSPPSTPGAPVLPKIDAGPVAAPAEVQVLQPSTASGGLSVDNSVDNANTMFAGLSMM